MSIDSLTVITPRPNPIMYTSSSTINIDGGVFSSDLDKIEIKNITHNQDVYLATLTNVSGNEYNWGVSDIPVLSVGLNHIEVKAYALDTSYLIEEFDIFVDYVEPHVTGVYTTDSNTGINIPIQIYFSESMDVDSVIANLSLTPEVPGGTWVVGGTDNVFFYNYDGTLDPLTTYTITADVNCYDSIHTKDPSNVYINAGNHLSSVFSASFTTGVGMVATDPTRVGLGYNQTVLNFSGDIIQNKLSFKKNDLYDISNIANFSIMEIIDPYRYRSYFGEMINDNIIFDTSETLSFNPPEIIDSYRYLSFKGDIISDENNKITLSNARSDNYFNLSMWKTGKYSDRHRDFNGDIIDYAIMEGIDDLPIIIHYDLLNKDPAGGIENTVTDYDISLSWPNPSDRDSNILEYKIELSRYRSFFEKIVFHSKYHYEFFETSDETGVVWTPYDGQGITPGSGFTRFISPKMSEGVWYVRLFVGNKRRKR